jgi:hypothetical protein
MLDRSGNPLDFQHIIITDRKDRKLISIRQEIGRHL